MLKRFLMTGLLVGFVGSTANAAIVYTDDFGYANGNLVGNGSWVAHSGTATPVQVIGGKASLTHGAGSREDVSVLFSEVSTGVISYSFDVVVNDDVTPLAGADGEYFAHFGQAGIAPALTSSFFARLDLVTSVVVGKDYEFGISSSTSTAQATTLGGFNYGDLVSVLVGYDFSTGTATLSVGGETVTGQATGSGPISAFALRQGNSVADETILIDNLVVSATAVPEPSTFAVLAIVGVAGVVQLRRRKMSATK